MHQQGHLHCSQDNWEWSCRISAAYCILRHRDQRVRPGSGLETGKSPFLVLAANKVTWSVLATYRSCWLLLVLVASGRAPSENTY